MDSIEEYLAAECGLGGEAGGLTRFTRLRLEEYCGTLYGKLLARCWS